MQKSKTQTILITGATGTMAARVEQVRDANETFKAASGAVGNELSRAASRRSKKPT
jgi:RNA-splicing ligase RtcB